MFRYPKKSSPEIVVSINENNEVSFVLYPNPVENIIAIESVKDAVVKIYSMAGQVVSQQSIIQGTNTIDVSELVSGIYFINIDGTIVKIVKK